MADLHYKITSEKLDDVVKAFQKEWKHKITPAHLEAFICYDWQEGDEHQEWIDNGPPQEIAAWAGEHLCTWDNYVNTYGLCVRCGTSQEDCECSVDQLLIDGPYEYSV